MSEENFTPPPSGPESNEPPAAEPASWGTAQPNYSQANYPPPPPPGYNQTGYPPPPPGYVPPPANAGLSDTTASALAYVTFIPAVIFLVLEPYNRKPVIKFHAIQELGLTIVGVILHFFWVIPILGWIIWMVGGVCLLAVWVFCIIKASQGSAFKIPVIGNFAAEQSGYRI